MLTQGRRLSTPPCCVGRSPSGRSNAPTARLVWSESSYWNESGVPQLPQKPRTASGLERRSVDWPSQTTDTRAKFAITENGAPVAF